MTQNGGARDMTLSHRGALNPEYRYSHTQESNIDNTIWMIKYHILRLQKSLAHATTLCPESLPHEAFRKEDLKAASELVKKLVNDITVRGGGFDGSPPRGSQELTLVWPKNLKKYEYLGSGDTVEGNPRTKAFAKACVGCAVDIMNLQSSTQRISEEVVFPVNAVDAMEKRRWAFRNQVNLRLHGRLVVSGGTSGAMIIDKLLVPLLSVREWGKNLFPSSRSGFFVTSQYISPEPSDGERSS